MREDLNSVLAVNRYLTSCKNDTEQLTKARKYLKYKLDKILHKKKKNSRFLFILGIPINLLSF